MIFSTIKQMIETVGRTRASNWGELDKLTCIWTGPTGQADSVVMGATHPQYGTMEVNAIRKIADVAGVTKLELEYVGLFNGGDIGPVLRGSSTSEGEFEEQQPEAVNTGIVFQSAGNFNPTTGQITGVKTLYTWKLFTRTSVIRYLSLNATFRYVAKGASGPRFGGGSIINHSIRPGGQTSPIYVAGDIGGPFNGITYYLGVGPFGSQQDNYCSGFQADPISKSWFRCSETWAARYIA